MDRNVIFRNKFVHVTTITEKKAMNLKENKKLFMGGLYRRKETVK